MISISILAADLMRLAEEVDSFLLAGIDSIHMGYLNCDHEAAINITLSISKSLRDYGVRVPISILLLGKVTQSIVKPLVISGVSTIYFSPTIENITEDIPSMIKECGCNSGILVPSEAALYQNKSRLPKLDDVLFDLDNMSAGYNTKSSIIETITNSKRFIMNSGTDINIVTSGELSESKIELLSEAGVDSFIIGKSMLSSTDYYTTISHLKRKLRLNRRF